MYGNVFGRNLLWCIGECCQSYSMYGSVLGATYCVLGSAVSLTPCMGVF